MLDEKDRLCSREQLNSWLSYELEKYGGRRLSDVLAIGEPAVLRKHIILLRKTEYYLNSGKKVLFLIYKARLRRLQNKYGMHVPLNCCGKGLRIMHVGPVLMNGDVTIGEDCVFHMNTGVVAGGTTDYAPVFESGVIMGFGSVVLGKTHIAKNVAIGANSVVNHDVLEENITVAGVPAKKISNSGSKSWGNKNGAQD